jgi:hypothetical protein
MINGLGCVALQKEKGAGNQKDYVAEIKKEIQI